MLFGEAGLPCCCLPDIGLPEPHLRSTRSMCRALAKIEMSIERDFDVSMIAGLAFREKQIQQNYRPIIGVHIGLPMVRAASGHAVSWFDPC